MLNLARDRCRRVVQALSGIGLTVAMVASLLLPSAPASAATVIAITVTASGEVLPGAFVAVVGPTGRFAGVTDGDGTLALANVPDGDYVVRASASGTSVGEVTVTVPAAEDIVVAVERTGTKFVGLGAYGAPVSAIVADAMSGVFYLSTESLPSVYRTADHGGTWSPVTLANDDAEHGIDAMAAVRVVATSGYPGEIAAITDNREGDPAELMRIWYSRDFGVTWRCITATIPIPAGAPFWNRDELMWGHVGDTSVLLTDGPNSEMWYALMPTDTDAAREPTLVRMTNAYKRDPNDRVTVVNGSHAPIVAVADATGSDVTLYTVTDTPDRDTAPSLTLAGIAPATAPRFVRLGGPTDGPVVGVASDNRMPSTVLVYSAEGQGAAVLSTYAGATWTQSSSAEFRRQEDDDVAPEGAFTTTCAATDESGAIGSVAPVGATGTVGSCWITPEGGILVARPVHGINNNTGVAFDAGYDGATNRVLMSGDGDFGVVKSADHDADLERPVFPSWPAIAGAGTGADSGGVAINGLDAARVWDVAYGPTADDIFAATGNGRMLGSRDGGDSWLTVLWRMANGPDAAPKAGASADWWQGAEAGTRWLMAGVGGHGDLLGVLTTTASLPDTPVLAALPETDIEDLSTSAADGMGASVSAIAGVSGQDAAFVGLSLQTDQALGGAVRRVELHGTDEPTIVAAGFNAITQAVAAMAYCPVEGSDPRVAGKLFVALRASTEGGADGGIAVVENAAAGPVTVRSPIAGDFLEVRAHCASGIVWAGRELFIEPGDGAPDWIHENGLMRSTDGGATFAPVTLNIDEPLAWRLRWVTAIGVDPMDPLTVIAVGKGGDVVSTRDGGATWAVQNDTRHMSAKHFGAIVNDVEIGPAESSDPDDMHLSSGAAESGTLLASGSGLFSADVRTAPAPTEHLLSIPLIRR